MADYTLAHADGVIRNADGVWIPNDPSNRDRVEYEQWLADGGVPDPYVEPDLPPPEPTPEQRILLDHENRILAQEGLPPLTIGDLLAKMLM